MTQKITREMLLDAGKKLEERANHILKYLGMTEEIRRLDYLDGSCDPTITFGTTGIGIAVMECEHKAITGNRPVIKYGAYAERHIPQTYWEPADVDIVELGEETMIMDIAIRTAIQEIIAFKLGELADNESYQEESELYA